MADARWVSNVQEVQKENEVLLQRLVLGAIRDKDFISVQENWPMLKMAIESKDASVDALSALTWSFLSKTIDALANAKDEQKAMKPEQFKAFTKMKVLLKRCDVTNLVRLQEALQDLKDHPETEHVLMAQAQRAVKQVKNGGGFETWMSDSSSGRSSESDEPEQRYLMPWDDPVPSGYINAHVEFKAGVLEPGTLLPILWPETPKLQRPVEPVGTPIPVDYEIKTMGWYPHLELKSKEKDPLGPYKRATDPDRQIVMYEYPDGRTEFMSQREAWAKDALVEKMTDDPNYGRNALEEGMKALSQSMKNEVVGPQSLDAVGVPEIELNDTEREWLTDAYYGRDALDEIMRVRTPMLMISSERNNPLPIPTKEEDEVDRNRIRVARTALLDKYKRAQNLEDIDIDRNYGKEAMDEMMRIWNQRKMDIPRPLSTKDEEEKEETSAYPKIEPRPNPYTEDRTVIWAEEDEKKGILTTWTVPTSSLPPMLIQPWIYANEMEITITKPNCSICEDPIQGTYYKCLDCNNEKEDVLICFSCEPLQAQLEPPNPGHTCDHVLAKIRPENTL